MYFLHSSNPVELNARLGEPDESHSESELHPEDFEEPLDDPEEYRDDAEEDSDDLDSKSSETRRYQRPFEDERFRATRKLLEMLYDRPSVLADHVLSSVTVFDLHVMERRYDKFNLIATEFAEYAWSHLRENDNSLPREITLSSAERDRFLRAIYRLEIFYIIFGVRQTRWLSVNHEFFLRHSPWENEQMCCIYDLLEMKFASAANDVFAHDVAFGKSKVDYLTFGAKNHSRQPWLSQGIEYICDVMTQDNYESRKRVLETTYGIHGANFNEVLVGLEEQMFSVDIWQGMVRLNLPDGDTFISTKEGVLSRVLCEEEKDYDLGPSESWIAANLGTSKSCPNFVSLLWDGNDWLRGRAYLFWDWDRVQRHQFLDLWQNAPVMIQDTSCPESIKEMEESFAVRSKIWHKGGRGYWSRGDTSRIVWPERDEAEEQNSIS
ncbi:major facilitator superfamily transporter multidrug resistance [Colletotrichum kahawae]|uniref:Major facilitator superfamily transporter multidrug resistance n=1 Tax=Colletotrichum kahawae TaxID=34407 RepID=A0AAD9XXZ3_COLKA|nr:major facilitator superfamily transporter multidrug resistance [Colletotrichum kahawae]